MKFGEHVAQHVKDCIDLRRKRGASVAWEDCKPEIAAIAQRLLNHGPREMAECPVCSQVQDRRRPAFWLAHRSTLKANGDSRWILVGCSHATAISFNPILTDEDCDAFERAWTTEVKTLFQKHTEHYSPATRSQRALAIGLIEENK